MRRSEMLFGVLCVLVCTLTVTYGHGRLIDPPARGSAWRKFPGQDLAVNYNDHEMSCGGVGVQYGQNNGACGVCGDPASGDRPHEDGGRYGTGFIVETYTPGQVISATVEMTANHKGYFEFRLCVRNSASGLTQACFDRNLLTQPSGQTRNYIGTASGNIVTQLRLPPGVTCEKCVLQWIYTTGNSHGVCGDGTSSPECNTRAEKFYGCADIRITGSTGVSNARSTSNRNGDSNSNPNRNANTGRNSNGNANRGSNWGANSGSGGSNSGGGTASECEAVQLLKSSNMDTWCRDNCRVGHCPSSHCICNGGQSGNNNGGAGTNVPSNRDRTSDGNRNNNNAGRNGNGGNGRNSNGYPNRNVNSNGNGNSSPNSNGNENSRSYSNGNVNSRSYSNGNGNSGMNPNGNGNRGRTNSNGNGNGGRTNSNGNGNSGRAGSSNGGAGGSASACQAAAPFTSQSMTDWCIANCRVGNCPTSHCNDACRRM